MVRRPEVDTVFRHFILGIALASILPLYMHTYKYMGMTCFAIYLCTNLEV